VASVFFRFSCMIYHIEYCHFSKPASSTAHLLRLFFRSAVDLSLAASFFLILHLTHMLGLRKNVMSRTELRGDQPPFRRSSSRRCRLFRPFPTRVVFGHVYRNSGLPCSSPNKVHASIPRHDVRDQRTQQKSRVMRNRKKTAVDGVEDDAIVRVMGTLFMK
jgi:hypothetical protein